MSFLENKRHQQLFLKFTIRTLFTTRFFLFNNYYNEDKRSPSFYFQKGHYSNRAKTKNPFKCKLFAGGKEKAYLIEHLGH